ncbi:putative reverse transcriptase domain-containing protein, partial [Tanacetum coccineum]
MPPRIRTRSSGQPAAKSLGGGTGVQVGRGGRGRTPREGNDERVDDLNDQGNDQEMGANGGIEGVNGNIRTLSQEVAISMTWNNFKFMMIEEFCPSHEMQKLETELWNHAMVGAGHAAYTDRFHELASQNQALDINGGQGRGSQGNQARGRAFMLGAEEARQDPNI